jgi:uroporphyrinogen decarboxylase
MNPSNDLLLKVAAGEATQRPPVWLMRQAGRILPEYRALRSSVSGFKELVKTPDLVAEVTVQPVDALGVDAAILFSDILVIPEAMGLDYLMVEKVGPRFPKVLEQEVDVKALISGAEAAARLEYVYEGIDATLQKLGGKLPLIGFSGAPWTLMAYMVEGQGSKTFSKAKSWLYARPDLAHLLLDRITDTIIAYLQEKIRRGVHLVQLFDSWAGLLSPAHYQEFAIPYLSKICKSIQAVPVTVFAKGAWHSLKAIGELDAQVVGLDWTIPPSHARTVLGSDQVVQGNLDPCQLYGGVEEVAEATQKMLRAFGPHHIANLGHGVYPDTPLDSVKTFVKAVQEFKYDS